MITRLKDWKNLKEKLVKESISNSVKESSHRDMMELTEQIITLDEALKAIKSNPAITEEATLVKIVNDINTAFMALDKEIKDLFGMDETSSVANENTEPLLIEEGTGATVTIDASRIDRVVSDYEAKAAKVKKFAADKIAHLKQQEPIIISFLNKFGGKDLNIDNMYSTGLSDEYYNDDKQMIGHCKFTLSKEYKNPKLLAQKLDENWRNLFPKETISAQFNDWKIKGTFVEFQIWVY